MTTLYMETKSEHAVKWKGKIDDELSSLEKAEKLEIIDPRKKGKLFFWLWVLKKKRTAEE